MFHHAWLALLSGAAAVGLLASAAAAAPLGPRLAPPAEAGSLVQKVHRCHDRCRWGPRRGWHRHVGRFCRPVRWGCRRMWFRPNLLRNSPTERFGWRTIGGWTSHRPRP